VAWTKRDKIGASFVGCFLLVCVGGLVGGYYALESWWAGIVGLDDSFEEPPMPETSPDEIDEWLAPTGGAGADLEEMWLRLEAIRTHNLRTTRVFVFAPISPLVSPDLITDQVTHAGGSAPLPPGRWPTVAPRDDLRAGVVDTNDRRMLHALTLDLRADGEGIISLFTISATFTPPVVGMTSDLAIVRYDEPGRAIGPPARRVPLEHRPLALDTANIPLAVFALSEADHQGVDLDEFVRTGAFDGFAPDISVALHELRRKVVDEGHTELTRALLEIGDSLYAVPGYVYGEPLHRRTDAPFFFRARAPFTGSPYVHAVDVYDGEIWLDP